jgi:hypothetical protein
MLAVTVAFGLAAIAAAVHARRAVAADDRRPPGAVLQRRTAERALADLERVVAELLSAS